MRRLRVSVPVLLLAVAPYALAECPHLAQRQARLDAAGARRVRITALAGSLRIEGQANGNAVQAEGQACAGAASELAGVQLRAERRGDELLVEVVLPTAASTEGLPRLDLTVRVPTHLPLEVTDTSGDLSIADVAALALDDASGDVLIERVAHDVRLRDTSGDVRLREIKGAVTGLVDTSGGIEIGDVGGSVRIDEDTSGDIVVAGVGGSVVIGRDGSGAIEVRRVAGDFTVESDGSGGIRHEDVKGKLTLPEGKRRP